MTMTYVLPTDSALTPIYNLGGAFFLDPKGRLTLAEANGDPHPRHARFFWFGGEESFVLFHTSERGSGLNLGVDSIELVAEDLEQVNLADATPGTLCFTQDGASIVLRDQPDGETLLFNLAAKEAGSITSYGSLATKTWTLRAIRSEKVVFEYEVQAWDTPEVHRVTAQLRNPVLR